MGSGLSWAACVRSIRLCLRLPLSCVREEIASRRKWVDQFGCTASTNLRNGGRNSIRFHHKPPWPNGQGVGLLIRRLRVRVPQEVLSSCSRVTTGPKRCITAIGKFIQSFVTWSHFDMCNCTLLN